MVGWRHLNTNGRLFVVCCIINIWVAFTLAYSGHWTSLFPAWMAMICGLSTYNKRYHIKTADDINEEKKETEE